MQLSSIIVSRLIVLVRSPSTLRERARFTASEGMQPWDRALAPFVGLIGPAAIQFIAGLDHRLGWTSLDLGWGRYLASLVVGGAYGLAVWAMTANEYFSSVARIQKDRGQVVVEAGPYRLVRHPAYAGALLASLAVPVMLGTLWALAPAVINVAALFVRTELEDQLLRDELDGYRAYARKTRYRLIPGLW
jgi:protein-S-isoprenylcysteine O-methyltransferase Ste14